jgi:dGTPase
MMETLIPSSADLSGVDREHHLLATYAMRSADSAGRKHTEPEHPYRGPYQRDRDRIIHSSAYRRLAYKTQVFTGEMGDYHRTRLTHTLEVASIARTLARALQLNEDLVEALALAHDIGHPPFGHAGEQVLNECLVDEGGFNHNAHAIRIVELLETRYPLFPGLNLTHEVREGQASRAKKSASSANSQLLEVQVVDAADSITYTAHDADDALQIGLLQAEELAEVPLWKTAVRFVKNNFGMLTKETFRRATVHQLIECQVSDLIAATKARIQLEQIESVGDVRSVGTLVAPSPDLASQKADLEDFLFEHVYRHPDVLSKREISQQALRNLFSRYREDPTGLPVEFENLLKVASPIRLTADYLASLTDHMVWEMQAASEV